jgi:hypothetical protein
LKFKKEGKVLLIIVISAAMAVISMFMTDNSDKLFCSIKRPEPGEESQVKRINVVGEDGESITSVDVEIAPRIMTQDEAAGCFEKAYEEIAGIMCGRNKDLEHVTSNLVLPETAQRGVVSLTWYSGNYELINYNGNVNNIGFSENECQNVELKLIMEYEDYKSEYDFAVTVFTIGNEGLETLSTYIYADARKGGLTPELRPLSTIIFVVVLALLIVINRRAGKEKK